MLSITNYNEEWAKDYGFNSEFNTSFERDLRKFGPPIKALLKPKELVSYARLINHHAKSVYLIQ